MAGENTESIKKKRGKEATLKNHKDVERLWIGCILCRYLFISVSCLRVTPTLILSATPNWNQISGRLGGGGCFSGSRRKDWIKKGGDFMGLGFLGEKKISKLVVFFLSEDLSLTDREGVLESPSFSRSALDELMQ